MNFQTRMKHFFTIFSTGSRFTSNLILLDFNLKKFCKYPRLFKTLCYSKLFDFKIYFISSYNFACSWGYFNFETEASYLLAMNLIYAGYIWMKWSCAGELLELILHSKQDHYCPTAVLTAPFHSSAKDAALKRLLNGDEKLRPEWERKATPSRGALAKPWYWIGACAGDYSKECKCKRRDHLPLFDGAVKRHYVRARLFSSGLASVQYISRVVESRLFLESRLLAWKFNTREPTSSRGGFLHGGGFLLRETAPAPHFCMDLAPTECVWERRGGKEVVAGLTGVFRKWEIILAVCFCGGSGNCMHSASHSLALLSHSCFPRKNPSHAKADSNNWCVFVWLRVDGK